MRAKLLAFGGRHVRRVSRHFLRYAMYSDPFLGDLNGEPKGGGGPTDTPMFVDGSTWLCIICHNKACLMA